MSTIPETGKPISYKQRLIYAKRIARLIQKVKSQHDLTTVALADELGIKHGTFYGWVAGTKCPKHRVLYDKVMADLNFLLVKDKPQLELDITEPVRSEPNTPRPTTRVMGERNPKPRVRVSANGVVRAPTILEAAAGHMVNRAATYDSPDGERSMEKTIATFNALTGNTLTVPQGWHFMGILKMVRAESGAYCADCYEDGAAYFALAGEAAAAEQ